MDWKILILILSIIYTILGLCFLITKLIIAYSFSVKRNKVLRKILGELIIIMIGTSYIIWYYM